VRNVSCINLFLAFELASLMLELVQVFFSFSLMLSLRASSKQTFCFSLHISLPLASVSFVWPGVVSGLFQTSAEMPFEAYIVM
jgi:hypothetical protein